MSAKTPAFWRLEAEATTGAAARNIRRDWFDVCSSRVDIRLNYLHKVWLPYQLRNLNYPIPGRLTLVNSFMYDVCTLKFPIFNPCSGAPLAGFIPIQVTNCKLYLSSPPTSQSADRGISTCRPIEVEMVKMNHLIICTYYIFHI